MMRSTKEINCHFASTIIFPLILIFKLANIKLRGYVIVIKSYQATEIFLECWDMMKNLCVVIEEQCEEKRNQYYIQR